MTFNLRFDRRLRAASGRIVRRFSVVFMCIGVFLPGAFALPAGAPVTLTENGSVYTLANDIVLARVNKRSGELVSLRYKNLDLLGGGSGHPYGYWSHAPAGGMRLTNSVTLDPARNGGERAEVSIKGFYDFAANPNPRLENVAADIEIRYTLGRGDSGIYTYSIFTHPPSYPGAAIEEARFALKLNAEIFDYLSIDSQRQRGMPSPADWDRGTELSPREARLLNTGIHAGEVEHKYDYAAIQFNLPAYGWCSTRDQIGVWLINPSTEYLSGGATKVELTGHLDNNKGAYPTLLNYWRGSHYGGSSCVIASDENWTKVIGPFFIYCNSGGPPAKLWKNALHQATNQTAAWPFDWVSGVDYPHRRERGGVTGKIQLADALLPRFTFTNLLVGLAAPDYPPPVNSGSSPSGTNDDREETGLSFTPPGLAAGAAHLSHSADSAVRARPIADAPLVDWQLDAKYYQFWTRGDSSGRFAISKVRPGTYTLHAIADGVLGEAILTRVTVAPGQTLKLGELVWRPARYGRPLWEIGIPNRSAEEFRHGNHYWQWGLYHEYPKEFPQDVHFIIGKSNPRTDWNYAQVPRGDGSGTTWSILFELPQMLHGKAILRLGIAAASIHGGIQVAVNGHPAGDTGPLADTATIRRDGIRGYWTERDVAFNADLLQPGTNVLTLTIPPGQPMNGVEYDYLRLESDGG